MAFTSKNYRAIKWMCEEYDLKPRLSAWPTIYFIGADGKEVKHSVQTIVDWYDGRNKRKARKAAK